MSGGKDSTATALKAIEEKACGKIQGEIRGVFADTGHEHPLTYEYVDYLELELGIKIVKVKPDFSDQIKNKRKLVAKKWVAEGLDPIKANKIIDLLEPTGNPFLDLAIWKGRFPSSQARFCTEELKNKPIMAYQESLINEFDRITIWIGVRRDESASRAMITSKWECEFGDQGSNP